MLNFTVCKTVCLLMVDVVQPGMEQTLLCTLCSVGVLIRTRDPLIAAMITERTICDAVMAGSLAERVGRQSGTGPDCPAVSSSFTLFSECALSCPGTT